MIDWRNWERPVGVEFETYETNLTHDHESATQVNDLVAKNKKGNQRKRKATDNIGEAADNESHRKVDGTVSAKSNYVIFQFKRRHLYVCVLG